MDDRHIFGSAGIRLAERVRCKLYLRRHRHIQSEHTLGHADSVDRHVYLPRLRAADARRPLLRHVRLYHIRHTAVAAVCNDIQPPRDKRLALMARAWPAATAACRVCQVCHSPCRVETDEHLRLQHAQMERHGGRLRGGIAADALHRGTERNRLGTGLHILLPHVLPRRNDRQRAVHGRCNGYLFSLWAYVTRKL